MLVNGATTGHRESRTGISGSVCGTILTVDMDRADGAEVSRPAPTLWRFGSQPASANISDTINANGIRDLNRFRFMMPCCIRMCSHRPVSPVSRSDTERDNRAPRASFSSDLALASARRVQYPTGESPTGGPFATQ